MATKKNTAKLRTAVKANPPMSRRKELMLQLQDAKRTGDKDWADELQQELDALDEEEVKGDTMDDNPSDDEEELEQIYVLDPEIAAELERPVSVAHVLVAEASATTNEVIRVAKTLAGNAYEPISGGIMFTADVSFLAFVQSFKISFARDKPSQVVKHGQDTVITVKTFGGRLTFHVDKRGFIDSIYVEG